MIRRSPGLAILAACVVLLPAGGPVRTAGAEPAPLVGTVQAAAGKFSGAVKVQNGKLTVGDRELKLDDTLYLALQTPEAAETSTNALRLVGGDYWRVELLKLTSRAVNVQSPALGPRRALLPAIQALEFAPARVLPDMDQPETMYLSKGAPLPGSLVWIKDRDVAVNSPLGVLPLPRASLICYVLRRPGVETNAALDEVRLTDGSLYHGRLGIEGDQFTLQHALLDSLKIQPGHVRYYSRASSQLQWLSALAAGAAPGTAPPELLWPRPGAVAAPCLQALRLQPSSVQRYNVPAAGGAWIFQATIAPRPSNAGDVRLELRVGERAVWQRTLQPASKPEAVTLTLPAGQPLELVADFGERLAFPAGVDLCDPLLRVAEPGKP